MHMHYGLDILGKSSYAAFVRSEWTDIRQARIARAGKRLHATAARDHVLLISNSKAVIDRSWQKLAPNLVFNLV